MSSIHKVKHPQNKTTSHIYNLPQRKSLLVKKPLVKTPSLTQSQSLDRLHISHELRIALSGILGSSYLLEQTPLDESQKDLLKLLNASANRLLALADQL